MCVVIDVVPLHYDVRVGADIIRPWFCCNNKTGRHRGLFLNCERAFCNSVGCGVLDAPFLYI